METKQQPPPSKHLVILRFKHLRAKHKGFVKQFRLAKTEEAKAHLLGKVIGAEKELKEIIREYDIRVKSIA